MLFRLLGDYGTSNDRSVWSPCQIAVIYCEIWEEINGTLTKIRDFFPAQKDGKYGLYDKITGVFCGETTNGKAIDAFRTYTSPMN